MKYTKEPCSDEKIIFLNNQFEDKFKFRYYLDSPLNKDPQCTCVYDSIMAPLA